MIPAEVLDATLARLQVAGPSGLEARCLLRGCPVPGVYRKHGEPLAKAFSDPIIEVAMGRRVGSRPSLAQVTFDQADTVVVVGTLQHPVWSELGDQLLALDQALVDVLVQPEAFGNGITAMSYEMNYDYADPALGRFSEATAFVAQVWVLDDEFTRPLL